MTEEEIKQQLPEILKNLINTPVFKNIIWEIIEEFHVEKSVELHGILINRKKAMELLGISRYKFDLLNLDPVNENGHPLYKLSEIKRLKRIIHEVY